jgi:hypothetical protein
MVKSLQSLLAFGDTAHANGTTTNTAADIVGSSKKPILEVIIHNTGTTNTLYISFDGGTTFFSIGPDAELMKRGQFETIYVKSKTTDKHTTYEALLSQPAM